MQDTYLEVLYLAVCLVGAFAVGVNPSQSCTEVLQALSQFRKLCCRAKGEPAMKAYRMAVAAETYLKGKRNLKNQFLAFHLIKCLPKLLKHQRITIHITNLKFFH